MMNKVLKYILISLCGALLAAVLVLSYLAGAEARTGLVCRGIEVTITDSLERRKKTVYGMGVI